MGPWFAGDGLGETYLDTYFTDDGELSGKKMFAIDDFWVSLNKYNPGP